jgi:sodium/hydrogen exchanger 8
LVPFGFLLHKRNQRDISSLEAGYSLNKQQFFDNIGAITMFAMIGTIISTMTVGTCTFYAAKYDLISGVSKTNPMEALLFGALISAVDPVATLSIMGSPELQCNSLLYSLVFGESVMNDAIAITLFNTFREYYDPDAPDLGTSELPYAFLKFFYMTFMSILVGVLLGLLTSFIFKQTSIRNFPKLETTLLLLFSYCCYSTAEALSLSGIMALFFNGICLSHYNAYNLSQNSRHATEQVSMIALQLSHLLQLKRG